MKKYLHIKYLHIAVVVVSLLLVGCTNHEDSPKNPSPDKSEELIRPNYNWNGARPLQEIAPKNVERINTFSINLFKTVFKNNVENMCISPASVFYTLSMMANGDDGKSRDEILDVLGYPIGEEGLLELNVFANALLRETTQFEGDTQCGFTNSIWHRPSMNLLPTFTTIIKDIYGGIIQPIWLGDENGLTTLNTFICNQTQGITTSFLNKTDLSNLIFLILHISQVPGRFHSPVSQARKNSSVITTVPTLQHLSSQHLLAKLKQPLSIFRLSITSEVLTESYV